MRTIQMFRCMDSFSTQLVGHLQLYTQIKCSKNNHAKGELAHCLVKWLYGQTNKQDVTKQIGQHVRRLEHAQLAREQQSVNTDDAIEQDLDVCYQLSNSQKDPVNIYTYVRENQHDPAFNRFIPKLKDHLLGHLLNRDYDSDTYGKFTDEERNTVCIAGEQIYRCKTIRINYTTYDVRCDGDTINPRTYPDIMVKSPETGQHAQPYWYAHVIGIFHTFVSSCHPQVTEKLTCQMDFLWVQQFGVEPGRYRHGFRYVRLPKIGFVESIDEHAFTFLDPAQVIRGSHLIPAFSEGRTSALLQATKLVAWVLNPEEENDWVNFYVNM